MIELVTRDADGISRFIRIGTGGLDLTPAEHRVLRNARFPDFLRYLISAGGMLLFLGFGGGLLATVTRLEWMEGVAAAMGAFGMVALICGVTWLTLRSIDYKAGDMLARAWLDLGRCPACGFHVAACSTDAGGVVKCPECAARWSVEQAT